MHAPFCSPDVNGVRKTCVLPQENPLQHVPVHCWTKMPKVTHLYATFSIVISDLKGSSTYSLFNAQSPQKLSPCQLRPSFEAEWSQTLLLNNFRALLWTQLCYGSPHTCSKPCEWQAGAGEGTRGQESCCRHHFLGWGVRKQIQYLEGCFPKGSLNSVKGSLQLTVEQVFLVVPQVLNATLSCYLLYEPALMWAHNWIR